MRSFFSSNISMSPKLTPIISLKQAINEKKLKKLATRDLFHKIAGLSKTQRLVLNYFLFVSRKVHVMYMTQTRVGMVVGCTREWVSKCIKLLVSLDLMRSFRRRYHYGWKTNIYDVKNIFFKPAIAYQLFTMLSSLREFAKQFTQLESEISIKSNHLSLSLSREDDLPSKKEVMDTKKEPIDILGLSFSEIWALRTASKRELPPTPLKSTVRQRKPGFVPFATVMTEMMD